MARTIPIPRSFWALAAIAVILGAWLWLAGPEDDQGPVRVFPFAADAVAELYLVGEGREVTLRREGDLWRLTATCSKASPAIDVQGETAISLGEPYRSTVRVPDYIYRNFARTGKAAVRLSFVLKGSGGEVITDIWHAKGERTRIARDKNGRRPAAATYTIMTRQGRHVASGSFKYG